MFSVCLCVLVIDCGHARCPVRISLLYVLHLSCSLELEFFFGEKIQFLSRSLAGQALDGTVKKRKIRKCSHVTLRMAFGAVLSFLLPSLE